MFTTGGVVDRTTVDEVVDGAGRGTAMGIFVGMMGVPFRVEVEGVVADVGNVMGFFVGMGIVSLVRVVVSG